MEENKSLKDKIKDAKAKAMAEQKSRGGGGDESRWKPEPNKELHFRILGRVDAPEPWAMQDIHYVESPDGTKLLACGGEDECYTCQKLDELGQSGSKEDKKRAHRSRKQTKIQLQVVDWDHRDRGPLLWEPKNTQSCSQWMNILGLIDNADFGPAIYKFKEGRLITMSMTAQSKKIEGAMKQVLSLRSMQAGTKPLPVVVGKTKDGFAIQLTMKDGVKKTFPLFDLAQLIQEYDENAHRAAWGDTVIDEEIQDVEDEEPGTDEDFADIAGDEEEEEPKPKKKAKKPPVEDEEESGDEEPDSEPDEEEEPKPKKKAKKPAADEEEEGGDFDFDFEDEEEPPKKKKGGKK